MEIEIRWTTDRKPYPRTELFWDLNEPEWLINPDRQPTEEELSACPKVFTCYSDGEKHPIRELGGRYHDKWFCSRCIPYIDEWTAGAMVWWEKRRHPGQQGFAEAKPGRGLLERLESVLTVVEWAKEHGYPLP
jgi:hypothetical protein